MFSVYTYITPGEEGGTKDSLNSYTWRLRPEIQTLTLLYMYATFERKGNPFIGNGMELLSHTYSNNTLYFFFVGSI